MDVSFGVDGRLGIACNVSMLTCISPSALNVAELEGQWGPSRLSLFPCLIVKNEILSSTSRLWLYMESRQGKKSSEHSDLYLCLCTCSSIFLLIYLSSHQFISLSRSKREESRTLIIIVIRNGELIGRGSHSDELDGSHGPRRRWRIQVGRRRRSIRRHPRSF